MCAARAVWKQEMIKILNLARYYVSDGIHRFENFRKNVLCLNGQIP